ncbi:tRNA (guanine(37)-N1)-methyltransferase 1 [Hibiscus syriacus]|uniref:tRNA (Guanine(37)-N1)-methyltransferase 1 n=1 Tax=Hibiscus syriacus TaxID=106335 RepID=A0A6A2XKY4_HIBSY|nr:tRNA (guanine(37)-N1)-methyltransferase 1 [Hibiscus syriacus]
MALLFTKAKSHSKPLEKLHRSDSSSRKQDIDGVLNPAAPNKVSLGGHDGAFEATAVETTNPTDLLDSTDKDMLEGRLVYIRLHWKGGKWSWRMAVLVEETRENSSSTIELVRCKLTLFYDYWQMNEILETLLPEGMIIPSAFETVGHIAHLNLKDEHLPYKNVIAKVVLDKKKPKIQTVVNKIDVIQNDYRKMQLEVLAGNHSLVTTVVENGLRFRVDLAKVYWNSRLGTERQRLLSGFDRNDVICDVFSGGPIAISAAKIVKRVYANDLNPFAINPTQRSEVTLLRDPVPP